MYIAIAFETLCSDSSDMRQPTGTVNLGGDEHDTDCNRASTPKDVDTVNVPPPPTKKRRKGIHGFFLFRLPSQR